ncbi:hypothetical protein [Bacillus mycoides]|uniref:hypothetical protein n=1 Tax=Bacillus mycoides TaxID=1405 RepID=UPI00187974A2|nr:hypothetical protein [Bacillus mycoides]MBE7128090.1 hypothetical protein [Bacillus mycoides]
MLELIKELGMLETSNGRKRRFVLVKCTLCDKELEMRKDVFKKSKSCGCIRKITGPQNSSFKTTHGLTDSPLYSKWSNMKERCYRPENKRYDRYGARGITIYAEWKDNFISFYNWCMDNGYKEGLQLDRIDNDGNYEPGNCRFVTPKQNSRNRSSNIIVSYNGEVMSLVEAAEKIGIPMKTLNRRYHRGDRGDILFRVIGKKVKLNLGEENPTSKITSEQAKEIKILLNKGIKQIEIAKMFDVSKYLISDIKRGKTWNHVKIDDTEVNE